jgi:hypothetical protein
MFYRMELTGLTVHDKIAVVLPEAASVIVIDCERRVVIGQEEIAADVVPRGNGRGGACEKRHSFLNFSYVCPEPVLVIRCALYIKMAQKVAFFLPLRRVVMYGTRSLQKHHHQQ